MGTTRRQFVRDLGKVLIGSSMVGCDRVLPKNSAGSERTITLYHILNYHGQPDTLENYAFLNMYQQKASDVILDLKRKGATDFYSEGIGYGVNPSVVLPSHYSVVPLLDEQRRAYASKDQTKISSANSRLEAQCQLLDAKYPFLRGGMVTLWRDGVVEIKPTEVDTNALALVDQYMANGDEVNRIAADERREDSYLKQIASTSVGNDAVLLLGAGHKLGGDKHVHYRTGGLVISRTSTKNNVAVWNEAQTLLTDKVYFELVEIDPLKYVSRR
jgi:hypothetical protein